jgi:hypothetical protein
MSVKRLVSVLVFPLALAVAASPASAESSAQTKPPTPVPVKVDSPNMVKSIRDWHPELNPQAARPTEASKGPACDKTNAQPTAATQSAANGLQTAQRPPQVSASGKPAERAREIPLDSVKW